MTASRDYALNILADISKYQSELAKVPGVTDKDAAKAAIALERRLSKAQVDAAKAAQKAAHQASDAWAKSGQGLKRISGAIGLGPIANDVDDLIAGLEMLGPEAVAAGVAVGGIAVAAGGIGAAIAFEFDAAYESSETLKAQWKALGNVWDEFVYAVGSEAAPAFEMLGRYVVAAALAALDAYNKFLEFRGAILDVADAIAEWTGAAKLARSAMAVVDNVAGDYLERADSLVGSIESYTRAEKERAKAVHATTKALEEQGPTEEEVFAGILAVGPAIWELENAVDELDAQILAGIAAEDEARAEAHEKELERIQEELEARREANREALQTFVSAISQAAQWELDRRTDTIDKLKDLRAQAQKIGDKEAIEAIDERLKAERRAALREFALAKAAAIAEATVNTALAITEVLANPVLAAAVAVAGAAQVAQIAAQKPPSLHTGGRIGRQQLQADETVVIGRQGESVNNQRATTNNWPAIQEMNRTGRLPTSASAAPIRVQFDGRDLNVMLARSARADGPFRGILNTSGLGLNRGYY